MGSGICFTGELKSLVAFVACRESEVDDFELVVDPAFAFEQVFPAVFFVATLLRVTVRSRGKTIHKSLVTFGSVVPVENVVQTWSVDKSCGHNFNSRGRMDDQLGFELLEEFSTLVEREMKVVGVDDVEDMVFDLRGLVYGFESFDRDRRVDLLERLAVAVEFTVEEPARWTSLDKIVCEMSDNVRVPYFSFFITKSTGLENSLMIESTDAVEFWLDIEWKSKFMTMVLPFEGTHWFHTWVVSRLIAQIFSILAQVLIGLLPISLFLFHQ